MNEPFTILLNGIVKGDGVITSPASEDIFFDISKEDILKMLKLGKNIELDENDNKDEFINGIKVIKTKYRTLENKLI